MNMLFFPLQRLSTAADMMPRKRLTDRKILCSYVYGTLPKGSRDGDTIPQLLMVIQHRYLIFNSNSQGRLAAIVTRVGTKILAKSIVLNVFLVVHLRFGEGGPSILYQKFNSVSKQVETSSSMFLGSILFDCAWTYGRSKHFRGGPYIFQKN